MKKLFVGNLPADASRESVEALFAEYGTVRSLDVSVNPFTGHCRGFGFIEMEGHEARAAVAGLDGKTLGGSALRVRYAQPKAKKAGRRRR